MIKDRLLLIIFSIVGTAILSGIAAVVGSLVMLTVDVRAIQVTLDERFIYYDRNMAEMKKEMTTVQTEIRDIARYIYERETKRD